MHVWSGRLPGGLAVAVVISCALMAAMVGVIGAEIVTMGVVALPAMLGRKYDKNLALGCICAGGGLATLIPPSVVFIMYGLTAGVSIGQLYMAGVVPGLLLAGVYIVYILARTSLVPGLAPPAPPEELAHAARREVRAAARARPAVGGGLFGARVALFRHRHADRGGRRRRGRRVCRDAGEPALRRGAR